MSKSVTLTITEDERAEFESLLDAYLAEVEKDKGEHEPSRLQDHQDLSDRAKLEALLDTLIAEREADRGKHEQAMARVDRNLAAIKHNLGLIRIRREA